MCTLSMNIQHKCLGSIFFKYKWLVLGNNVGAEWVVMTLSSLNVFLLSVLYLCSVFPRVLVQPLACVSPVWSASHSSTHTCFQSLHPSPRAVLSCWAFPLLRNEWKHDLAWETQKVHQIWIRLALRLLLFELVLSPSFVIIYVCVGVCLCVCVCVVCVVCVWCEC